MVGDRRQAHVVVGADHDDPLAADHHLGVLRGLQRVKVGIQPGGHGLPGFGILAAFVEQIHRRTLLEFVMYE
jgi:hypothetical protein